MRKGLQNIAGVRKRFIATFVRYGTKKAFKGPPIVTLLFSDVRDRDGRVFTDHIWFQTNKQFERYQFTEGDHISFDARVKQYEKGYKGNREDVYSAVSTDFKLSHPNNIVKSEQEINGTLF